MDRKIIFVASIVMLSTLLPSLIALSMVGLSSSETIVGVDPSTTTNPVCTTFDVNITVTNVTGLYDYTFRLRYNTTLLDVLNVSGDAFLDNRSIDRSKTWNNISINDGIGEVHMQAESLPTAEPSTGSGTLTTITFKCTDVGECDLILNVTVFKDRVGDLPHPTEKNGHVSVGATHEEPIYVTKNYTLCHDVTFHGCPGFIVHADDVVLDLNGHTATFEPLGGGPGPGFDGVVISGKHGVTIRNGTLHRFQWGNYVENSSDVTIIDMTVLESKDYGIEITQSKNVRVIRCTVSKSLANGIGADRLVSDILLLNNTVSQSGNVAIRIDEGTDIHILNNMVLNNSIEGISMWDSGNNTIRGNTLSLNRGYGLRLYNSADNTICGNIVSYNLPAGIRIETSSNNTVYNNSFINNKNVECAGSTNTWNYSYPYGGNYWSDHGGVDKFSGTNQDVPGSDGISETRYVIPGDNQDAYPLMNPVGVMLRVFDAKWDMLEPETEMTRPVAIFSNSSVASFEFDPKEKQISFTTTGGTFFRVVISEEILDGAFAVLIDGIRKASTLQWDKTHTFIDINYSDGNHNVRIKGETAVTILGDLNEDGEVNIIDIAMAAKNFGKKVDP